MNLIGRERELGILERFWEGDGYELGVVYGRRRIGKSFLLKHFAEGKRAIMLQATTSEAGNLRDLASSVSSLFPISSSIVYPSYENAFDDISKLAKEEKLLFIIDEVSFLEESNKDILSIIQKYSDLVFSGTKLKLILCSSMESFMVERILGGKTPLFGRSSLRLKLRELGGENAAQFFPSWKLDELSLAYVITGGIPYYMMRFAKYRTFDEALQEEFFSLGGALMTEPYFLLYSEVRNVDLYMEVMSLIAGGVNKTSKIADKAGISQALCSSMLRKLNNLSFISEKTNAVINSKVLGWEIKDNFLAFWFRFIYPAQKAIELDNAGPFFQKTLREMDEFCGKRIEETVRLYIINTSTVPIKDYGFLEFANPVEKKNEEIDFVALTEGDSYLFGEFKWKNSPVGLGVLDSLKRKTALVHSCKSSDEYYLISKSGFSDDLIKFSQEDIRVHLIEGKTIFGLK